MLDLILNETVVHIALVVLAVGAPVAGLLAGGPLRRRYAPASARAIQIGMIVLGPVTGALWLSYNGIVRLFGLDSVAGLAINVGMFALVGIVGGWGWRCLVRRDEADGMSPPLDGSSDSE